MKKIAMILFFLSACTFTFAQTTTKRKAEDVKDKTVSTTKNSKKPTGVNKDGSLDMRFKENKEAKKAADEKAKQEAEAKKAAEEKAKQDAEAKKLAATKAKKDAEEKTKATTKTVTQKAGSANNAPDKVIGKDDKGRTIYEGPRGGRYYINANGNKEYITKDKGN